MGVKYVGEISPSASLGDTCSKPSGLTVNLDSLASLGDACSERSGSSQGSNYQEIYSVPVAVIPTVVTG